MNSSGNTPPAGLSPEPFLIFYSHCPYKTPHSIRYVISLLAGGICERVIFGGGAAEIELNFREEIRELRSRE